MFFNIFTRDVGFNIAWPPLFALILDLMEFLFAQFHIIFINSVVIFLYKKDLILLNDYLKNK